MKVIIPKGTTELILPFNADKKNVIPWDVMTVLKANKVETFEASELATHVIEYGKPFVEGVSPGTLKTLIKTKDGQNSVDFDCEYTGLHGNIIIDTGKYYNSKITSTPVPTKVEILRK
ncbi:hypothetical protein [Myroides profundi]|uniref:Uncharacterized protein n=1 Tax=Myroides profundi TaxID=480520 RepID=A0AAJ4W3B9_MYRPR|nr:hypothetical protein [Myroides profundi]AJH15878.1 hypothetical protein MPR_2713 [Myroides profundi]SEQ72272.1 hypothetical protein SAMN04488089_105156 [Myroides profundi]